jgi:hypothetical protein
MYILAVIVACIPLQAAMLRCTTVQSWTGLHRLHAQNERWGGGAVPTLRHPTHDLDRLIGPDKCSGHEISVAFAMGKLKHKVGCGLWPAVLLNKCNKAAKWRISRCALQSCFICKGLAVANPNQRQALWTRGASASARGAGG